MNARQTKKCLKKQIDKLQSDNDLMRRIIADSPKMQELYDLYNKPLNYTVATMQFQEYQVKRYLPFDRRFLPNDTVNLDSFKQGVTKDLLDELKDYIAYEYEFDTGRMTASIFVGRKRG